MENALKVNQERIKNLSVEMENLKKENENLKIELNLAKKNVQPTEIAK